MISDNQTSFMKTFTELTEVINKLYETSTDKYLIARNIGWNFNSLLRPLMGGVWYLLVKPLKFCLKVIIKENFLPKKFYQR